MSVSKEKKSRKKTSKERSQCSIIACNVESDNYMTCCECNSIFHPECSDIDLQLFLLLNENKCEGLNWTWKCSPCVLTIDVNNKKSDLEVLKDFISTKIEKMTKEFKTEFYKKAENENLEEILKNKTTNKSPNELEQNVNIEENIESSILDENEGFKLRVKKQTMCRHYKLGKCRHGTTGKKIIEGKECPFLHPPKCKRFCQYGDDYYNGCNGFCKMFHPVLCRNSLNFQQCYRPNCTFTHLLGTKRQRNLSQIENTSYGNKNRYNNYSRNFPRQNFQSNSFAQSRNPDFVYNAQDFPKLSSPEETKITQINSDIQEMKQSLYYLMQNRNTDNRQTILTQQPPQTSFLSHENFITAPTQNNPFNGPKNFQPQNQYQEKQTLYQTK